ncbi:MAG TPA: YdiU family protein [Solirubrobacteraceae bacterium]|nr:YdiU family protein [Solirubrobacteraceae bacterium]
MSVSTRTLLPFAADQTYVRDLEGLTVPWKGAEAPAPSLLALNEAVAAELGADVEGLRTPEGAAVLAGSVTPEGSVPVAMAYAGHQFGGFSPRLGDGRALLLGEIVGVDGRRVDLHLKGSGRTPFARGAADGKAVVGPMLREYVISEAMHALGIPTTRSLAVVGTGEQVYREAGPLPGAVLARVAASHIRVGTFEYAATSMGPEHVKRLADYAIARHHPDVAEADEPYLAFLERVVAVQASLIAQWMLVGFIHGVMNTDNMTISGETIDYGPCAFMEAFHPETVFSSIDTGGRYAYGNQPQMAQWDLTRFAEALLPLLAPTQEAGIEAATAILRSFPQRFHEHWSGGVAEKLGLGDRYEDELVDELFTLLASHRVDYTSFFRALSGVARGEDVSEARVLFAREPEAFDAWAQRWLAHGPNADAMDRVNPLYIPRNHKVEEALTAATAGDLAPFEKLVDVVTQPFTERPGLADYAEPAPATLGAYRTFCGT